MRNTLFLILIFPMVLLAQEYEKMPDVRTELWNGATVEFKFNKKWQLELEQQLRLRSKGGIYDRALTQFEVDYGLFSWLNLGFNYRYINLNDGDGMLSEIENHKRISLYMSSKWLNKKRFYIKSRWQYQSRRELLSNTNKFVGDHRMYFRFKNDIFYNIKKWKLDPKLSFELFGPIPERGQPQGQNAKYRLALSTKYKLKGPHELNFKYIFEREAISWNPELAHIFNINYRYIIKYVSNRYLKKQNSSNVVSNDK